MPLKAVNSVGSEYISYQLQPSNYRQSWFCPSCQEPMSFVDANTRIKHFRHLVDRACHTEPETEEHLTLKKAMFELLTKYGYHCRYETKIGSNVADILACKGDEAIIRAIECQVSPIVSNEVEQRNKNYSEKGFTYFWVLFPKYYFQEASEYTRFTCYRLKEIERKFMFEPWLSYWNEKLRLPEYLSFKPKWRKGGGLCSTLYFLSSRRWALPRYISGLQ